MHIKVTRLTRAIGAVIEGVDLSAELADSTVDRLRQLLVEHEVMFFPASADHAAGAVPICRTLRPAARAPDLPGAAGAAGDHGHRQP